MSHQDEQVEDDFQPWNPVSYFEEENEATGGQPIGSSAYSPSKLASLFESNRLAIDQDLAMRKRLNQIDPSNTSESTTTYTTATEHENLDSLSQYTLEVDDGIKILDTTPAINRKAIFNDLDRLRRWRESVDTDAKKEVYVSDDDAGEYSYNIPDNTVPEGESNIMDLNMDFILNSLPDVATFDSSIKNVNYGKLHELENQFNVNENLFSIGSMNPGVINTTVTSNISDKKNNVLEEDTEIIIDKIIVGDTVSGGVSMNSISDLNRKNSNHSTGSIKDQDLNSINNENLNGIDTFNTIDISDELDTLFDDIDEGLQLPDVPEHDINFCPQVDNLEGLDDEHVGQENELVRQDYDRNIELDGEIINTTSISINNDLDINHDYSIENYDTNEVTADTTNRTKCLSTNTEVDCIDNTNSEECDLMIDDIISSHETASVDAFIDYVDNITRGDVDISDRIDITDLDQETVCNTKSSISCNTNSSISCNTNSSETTTTTNTNVECLAIENIIDAIENTAIDNTENSAELVDSTDASLEISSEMKLEKRESNELVDDSKTIDNEVNSLDIVPISTCITEQETEISLVVDAGSSTVHVGSSTVHDTCLSTVHDAGPSIIHDAGSSTVHDTALSTVHDAGSSTVHDAGLSAVHDVGLSAVHDVGSSTVHDAGSSTVHDAGSSAVHVKTVSSRSSSVNSDATESEFPIPIPKNVNLSSVLHKDSIGCLTPDDDYADMMQPSTSGYRRTPSSEEASTSETVENAAECDEVKNVQGEVCPVSVPSNVESVIDTAGDTGHSLSNAEGESNIANSNSELIAVPDRRVDELTAGSHIDAHSMCDEPDTRPSEVSPSLQDNRLTEVAPPLQDTIVEPEPVHCGPEAMHSGISDAVFDHAAGSSSITNTQGMHDTNSVQVPNTEHEANFNTEHVPNNEHVPDTEHVPSTSQVSNTEHAPSTEQVPGLNRSRSSGSVRRVRFSLDHEESGNSQDNASIASGSSFSEQPQTSSHGDDNSAPNTGLDPTIDTKNLGWVAPKWIPDCDAKSCMTCNAKFTVVKRRHHCRACGKVLCSQCCNMKFHLPYMDYKPVRVCQACCDIMITAMNGAAQGEQTQTPTEQQQQQQQPQQQQGPQTPATHLNYPLPEAPPPYSETVDGHSERLGSTSSNAPPYSEAASPRFDEHPAEVITAGSAMENLPVMRNFPNAPINDMMSFQLPGYSSNMRPRNSRNRSESEMSAVIMFNSTVTNLPPILRRDNEETRIINNPDLNILMKQMQDENEDPIAFIVNKNLVVRVKVVNMDCCVEKRCWCFVSDGMGASNQEEVVILIKCDSYNIDDIGLLRKVLQQMNAIFEKAKHGNAVSDSEQMEFNENIRCMAKNTGMLFYKPTLQCVKKLSLPTSPYLFGMYIEKSEVAWAKNFPLRLLLRIGAEFKYYPCPLFNVLDRSAVYEGVGRTILDLLADFRNFQYTLPRIVGVTINLRGKDTIIKLPRHRFDEVVKAVNAAEENVLSLAGNFSPTCDGHLVSVEKDGCYKTQTLSIVLKENRKVTCASFFVMSAALKPDQSGMKAKASIVEDGVMVQVTSEVIQEFKNAIKEMKEFTITAGNPSADDSSQVGIEWCTADVIDRPKLTSPIDATPFDNLTNMKIRHSYDYTSNNLTAKIHWVEVYFLPQDNDTTVQRLSARELGQMTSSIAKACMSALSPHLMTLIALEMTRIGLRVNLAANFVEYKIGSNLTTLPSELLPTLDDKLVPAVHNVMSTAQERVAVELIFQLVKIV